MRRSSFQSAISLGLCCIALAFSSTTVEAQQKRGAQPIPSVVVDIVREKDVSQTGDFIGRVEAVNSVNIRARVKGVLESRNFVDGQTVTQDQLLFVIESAPYQVVVDSPVRAQPRSMLLPIFVVKRRWWVSAWSLGQNLMRREPLSRVLRRPC